MKISLAQAIFFSVLGSLLIAGLAWFQLPWIRHTLSPFDSELSTRTLRIVSRDCREERAEFTVEIADTPQARAAGLQHREYLPAGRGMLFVWPDRAIRSMWMRDTPIALDMMFINPDGSITQINHRRRPHSDALTTSAVPVSAVLEIRGGLLHRHGIHGADFIVLPGFFNNSCTVSAGQDDN